MSENTKPPLCTVEEGVAARDAGLPVLTPADEQSIHQFAEWVRANSPAQARIAELERHIRQLNVDLDMAARREKDLRQCKDNYDELRQRLGCAWNAIHGDVYREVHFALVKNEDLQRVNDVLREDVRQRDDRIAALERVQGVLVGAAASEARRIYDAAYADGQADKFAGNCSHYMVANAAPQMRSALAAAQKPTCGAVHDVGASALQSAIDAAVAPYKLDAERYSVLKNGNFSVDRFVSAYGRWKSVPVEALDHILDVALAAKEAGNAAD